MKKIRTIVAALMLLSVSAFANSGDNVTAKVRNAFEKDFAKAQQVSWEKNTDFYFATFKINEILLNAAYNEAGELLGISKTIATGQLPMSVSMALARKYADYTLPATVNEINYDGETTYFVAVTNSRQQLQLKCSSNGLIEVGKKIKNQ